MVKNSIFFLSLFLFLGCDYRDFTEIKTGTTEKQESSVVSKSLTRNSTLPMVVILINYNNVKISSSDTVWHNKLFGREEHQLNNYYAEVSNNHFQYTEVVENSNIKNDGVISVYLDKNHPNTDVDDYDFESKTYGDFKLAS